MLDVISKKNSFFVIVNDRIFRYSLFGDNETLNIRFVSQQKTLCLSDPFFRLKQFKRKKNVENAVFGVLYK